MRREKLAHLELQDLPVPVDPLEMTVPRVTRYVSCTVSHTHTVMADALFKLSATDAPCHTFSVESCLPARVVIDVMSNIRVELSFIALICLQGPVGFPGDPGPPGEPGAAVSATYIPQLD